MSSHKKQLILYIVSNDVCHNAVKLCLALLFRDRMRILKCLVVKCCERLYSLITVWSASWHLSITATHMSSYKSTMIYLCRYIVSQGDNKASKGHILKFHLPILLCRVMLVRSEAFKDQHTCQDSCLALQQVAVSTIKWHTLWCALLNVFF